MNYKDLSRLFIVLTLSCTLVRCSSTEPKAQDLPDVSDAGTSVNPEKQKFDSTETSQAGETGESDLNTSAQKGNAKPEATPSLMDEPTTPPSVSVNNSVPESIPAGKSVSETVQPSQSTPSLVTGLDYRANDNGGTVVIKTDHAVTYTTRKNEKNNQYIIELANTTVPKKFQRALVTKEFPGIVASVNAYQSRGGDNLTRVVLQMKGPMDPGSEPAVAQSGNIINIATAGSSNDSQAEFSSKHKAKKMLITNNSSDDDVGTDTATTSATPAVNESGVDERILSNKTFDAFLLGRTKYYGNPISIEVNNQDVREVFKFISDESGLNIILDEDVKGRVTMKLRKVPWDQALAIILQSNQMGYVKNGSILRIATLKTLQTESRSARSVIDSQKELEPIRVQVYPLSYAKSDDVSSMVTNLLSPRGKVSADKRTNTLVVSDIAETLGKVKALMGKLDMQTPQVLIEAKIAEVKDTFSKAFGVDWGGSGGSTLVGLGAGQGAGPQPINFTNKFSTAYSLTQPGTLTLGITNLDLLGSLTATLQMAETNSLIHLISSPRIIAVDRVEATISQITEFPIVTTTPATTTTPAVTQVNFKDIKLELKVTPQITADGGILMQLSVQRDLIAALIAGNPEVDSRKASTQVLIENGETIMIGGIYQSDTTDTETGVPILKDIPFLGALFRYKEHDNSKNELVIFMTPRILNREKAFVKAGEAM